MRDLPIRKNIRLKEYDYSRAGYYFITVCVKDRHEMLGEIVGRDAHIAPLPHGTVPYVKLSGYGEIVDKYINNINIIYNGISVNKYVIMPNHIHMIIVVEQNEPRNYNGGAMWASRPTDAAIPGVIRSFKTMVTKEIGFSLWQTSYHDHIIRDGDEYHRVCRYIDENPANYNKDEH